MHYLSFSGLFLEVDYESLRGGRHKLTVRLVGTAMELGPYIGTMSGLFGNNNNNQDDDFYNPEKPGEVFNDVFAFAHSFKIGGRYIYFIILYFQIKLRACKGQAIISKYIFEMCFSVNRVSHMLCFYFNRYLQSGG